MNVSYLYTPALRLDSLVAHRQGIDANVLVVDLEDSIHFHSKGDAREKVATFDFAPLLDLGLKIGVRINGIFCFDGFRDLEMLRDLGQRGKSPFTYIFLPKVNHGSELKIYRSLVKDIKPLPRLYTFIETVAAVENADGIAAASDALCFGQADLTAEMYTPNSAYLDYARARLCVAAAKHQIQAIDTNSFEIKDLAFFEKECVAARDWGFTGKAAIHPRQVTLINRTFGIPKETIDCYREIIDTYRNSESGFFLRDGKVIAPPFVAKAEMMLNFIDKWSSE
jgi:citrate lyase subunit beta / citryl-CoA lyase